MWSCPIYLSVSSLVLIMSPQSVESQSLIDLSNVHLNDRNQTVGDASSVFYERDGIIINCTVAGEDFTYVAFYHTSSVTGKRTLLGSTAQLSEEKSMINDPTLELVWNFDSSKNHLGTYQLKKMSLKANESGTIECSALPSPPKAQILVSKTIDVQIQSLVPVAFLSIENKTETKSNGVLTVTCETTGRPPAEIKWFKDDEPFTTGSKVQINGGSNEKEKTTFSQLLFDVGFTQNEDGIYRCEATNRFNSVSHKFIIKCEGEKCDQPGSSSVINPLFTFLCFILFGHLVWFSC